MPTLQLYSNWWWIRFLLTQKCNQKCPDCSLCELKKNKDDFIDPKKIIDAFRVFSLWGYRNVTLYGGEPLLHPSFLNIYNKAQHFFPNIQVFTNGTITFPIKIVPRKTDFFIFNFDFNKNKTFIKNVFFLRKNIHPHLNFSIIVQKETDINQLKADLNFFVKNNLQDFSVRISMNCFADILKEKKILNQKIVSLIGVLQELGIPCGMAQKIPLCFFLFPLKKIIKSTVNPFCGKECGGLIDPNFNILSCGALYRYEINPRDIKPKNMFYKNKIISRKKHQEVLKQILKIKLKRKSPDPKCQACEYYKRRDCDSTGCFPYTKP